VPPQPVKWDSPRPELNLLHAMITTTHDDLMGHGVVSGREVPKRYRGRSYKRRVMIERVVQRKAANSFISSTDFDVWLDHLNNWTGAKKTRQELEDAIRECCQECR
jgi:hypothetical protein